MVYGYVPPEVYRTFGFPGADDLANMFLFKRDFEREFSGPRDVGVPRSQPRRGGSHVDGDRVLIGAGYQPERNLVLGLEREGS